MELIKQAMNAYGKILSDAYNRQQSWRQPEDVDIETYKLAEMNNVYSQALTFKDEVEEGLTALNNEGLIQLLVLYRDLSKAYSLDIVIPDGRLEIEDDPLYIWPIQSGRLTSVFGRYDYANPNNGQYVNKQHNAIDIATSEGIAVVSIADGVVLEKHNNTNNYGYSIIIEHANGVTSRYSHLKEAPALKVDDKVKQGTRIGSVGNTGMSTGSHLDFEIRLNGNFIDPLSILGVLPSGITADLRTGYVKQNEDGSYENNLFVPEGFSSPSINVNQRSK
jgi:murein DD-endopeptidase MepM/ murein hydrolase activator NlpD